jgi:Ca-activated chloride channel family protein
MPSLARLAFLAPFALGCAAAPAPAPVSSAAAPERAVLAVAAPEPASSSSSVAVASDAPRADGPWIGASGLSDFVLAGGGESYLGVWVDVPDGGPQVRSPVALSVIVDTSGSMAGAKMDDAKNATRRLVEQLHDGDIVALGTFDDSARERVSPVSLDAMARRRFFSAISELSPDGSTNLFDGLRLGEQHVARSPQSHSVRRVVVISDGQANVGPSSPEALGRVAQLGADQSGTQVTAIGVGLDYDERTLNALAMQSSGRTYHLAEPGALAGILERELGLLQASRATAAFVEVVPAPGVQLLGADGLRADRIGAGGLRIPLGTLFGGQHRELLVKVRVTDASLTDAKRPLASVRLHFLDPAEGNLSRIQEAVAHYQVTRDLAVVSQHTNARTQSIVAVSDAAQVGLRAAQQVNAGSFEEAERDLAAVEGRLKASAATLTDDGARQRVMAAAATVSKARAGAGAAAAAPPAARPAKARAAALEMNDAAMESAGY